MKGSSISIRASAAVAAIALGCGGNVLVGPGGSGGGGTTTGTCDDHDDCPGGLCLYSLGLCSELCPESGEPCPEGRVCRPCATSSCPGCKDCVAACAPVEDGGCDDHDDCPAGSVCLYSQQKCAQECGASVCSSPGAACDECATGSCPGCDDCVAACVF